MKITKKKKKKRVESWLNLRNEKHLEEKKCGFCLLSNGVLYLFCFALLSELKNITIELHLMLVTVQKNKIRSKESMYI